MISIFCSDLFKLKFGLYESSFLGPLLFFLYAHPTHPLPIGDFKMDECWISCQCRWNPIVHSSIAWKSCKFCLSAPGLFE